MTEAQIEYIIGFFRDERIAGWENIANMLVRSGVCVVAGDGNLWIGGIGNFLRREKAEHFIGCTRLLFNREEFIKSAWFQSCLMYDLKEYEDDLTRSENNLASLKTLIKDFVT